jgi:thiosulfate/3-mercaptopyruvate sulfurtransferase
MTRYVIIGAGAVGVTFAAQLAEAGRDVLLVARGEQLAALREKRLRYVRPDGERVLDVPSAATPAEAALRSGDILVLATKTQDAAATLAEWADAPVGDETGAATAGASLPVLTLQNGLDAERSALRHFATVFGGVLGLPANYVRPGEVVSPAAPLVGAVWVGRYPAGPAGPDERLDAVAADLRAAGFGVQTLADVRPAKAAKLLVSITFILDALYRPSEHRDRAAQLLREEARAVLTAAGQEIGELFDSTIDLTDFVIRRLEGQTDRGNSTWQSLSRSFAGRGRASSLETDYLNGEIVLLARLHGRHAPANAAALARIHRAAREGTAPRSLGDDDLLTTFPAAAVSADDGVLVDAKTLAEALGGPDAPALLDVRWALGDPRGAEHYRAGHIPGAVFVDLETELARPANRAEGRHPLPELSALTAAARRWGVRAGQPVVVYDDTGGLAAARAWWLLRWAGVADVRLLDGGLGAWRAAGHELARGDEDTVAAAAVPGDVVLTGGHLPVLSADEAAALAREGALLDARAAERYRGEVEPVDAKAGHIPGAYCAPTVDNLTAAGTFAAPEALRARFATIGAPIGAGRLGVYCGSGVTAAHEIAALRVAGVEAALFPGSWSAWSADPDRPVATGAFPG